MFLVTWTVCCLQYDSDDSVAVLVKVSSTVTCVCLSYECNCLICSLKEAGLYFLSGWALCISAGSVTMSAPSTVLHVSSLLLVSLSWSLVVIVPVVSFFCTFGCVYQDAAVHSLNNPDVIKAVSSWSTDSILYWTKTVCLRGLWQVADCYTAGLLFIKIIMLDSSAH